MSQDLPCVTTTRIDLSALPSIPVGWTLAKHQQVFAEVDVRLRDDILLIDGCSVSIQQAPRQTDSLDGLAGRAIRKWALCNSPLNGTLCEYLGSKPSLVPRAWMRAGYILFWATMYRDPLRAARIPMLYRPRGSEPGTWKVGYALYHPIYRFDSKYVSALLGERV